ncbi:TRAP transporter substrate-binding protein [Palleronia sp. LCG004]|uniref:TRAP transporter substrate-binding protein n=1 Tax=Palleronia sp. LCG004 TaxID=3079304 RepID=UPI002943058A|nr:TRAP transporter substrate-binding protein [Palleronia sp. LCG004]WOI57164.1 TRAP transporter substrate-binding protein [Palleronia sp. LCG004]
MLRLTALICCLAGPGLAQDVTLRMHQFQTGDANVPRHVLSAWEDRVETASGGRIEIQRFDAMALGGSPADLYDQVVDGVVDVVWTLPGYSAGRFPRAEVFELPFIMTDPVATSRAYWRLGDEVLNETDFKDVKVLGLWVHGPGVLHSQVSIRNVEDLRGVTLRAPSRITNRLFSDLGATTVGMPVPAVPEALSRHVIEATALPWEVTGSLRIAELVDTHTEFAEPIYTATYILAMNRQSWEALPDDLKAVIDAESGEDFSVFAARNTFVHDAPARAIAEDLGNEIITLDLTETDEWRQASQPTIDSWIKEMTDRGIDGSEILDRARTLIAESAE